MWKNPGEALELGGPAPGLQPATPALERTEGGTVSVHRSTARCGPCFTVLAIAVLFAGPPSASAFDGSFESGVLGGWSRLTDLAASPPSIVTRPVRAGAYAASMTIAHGQKRSELQALNSDGTTLKVYPGSTWWFADSEYLLAGFPTYSGVSNGWQTVLQWKDAGGTRSASPPISLAIRNGRFLLYGGWGCPTGAKTYWLDLAPAAVGAWTDFQFHIHFATAGAGWVDAYANGVQVIDHYFPPCGTSYPAPDSSYQTLRVGYYRDPAIVAAGTIVHDEYRMGATQADVALP